MDQLSFTFLNCYSLYILNYETKEELVTIPVSRDCLDDVKVSPGQLTTFYCY